MATYRYFNFFDQFEDIKIDLGPYVDEFSTPDDEIVFSNEQPVVTTLPNIFEHIKILTEYRGNVLNFQPYQIQDGERIENVAFNLYGNIHYWWIIAVFNDIQNPWTQWTKTDDQLHYLAEILTTREGLFPKETYYKLLFDENESRRNVTILKPNLVQEVVWNMRRVIQTARNEDITL
jgi:hypothetical protein